MQVHLGVVVHREGAHAVDFGRLDAGVGQRSQGRLHRQAHLGTAGILGKFGRTDAGDGHLSIERPTHFACSGQVTTSSAVTCWPSELLPLALMVTRPVAASVATTVPLSTSSSPA